MVRVDVPRAAPISSTVCPLSFRMAIVLSVGSGSLLIKSSNASANRAASSGVGSLLRISAKPAAGRGLSATRRNADSPSKRPPPRF